MASPPAKRLRRSTVILSDDDDSDYESPREPLRTSSKTNSKFQSGLTNSTTSSPAKASAARTSKRKAPVKASPKSSPEKSKKGKKTEKEPEKNKSLHTFFGKATNEQRWNRKLDTPEVEVEEDGEFGDAIEDDGLSDDSMQFVDGKTSTKKALDRRKALLKPVNGTSSSQKEASNLSQRFVKSAMPQKPNRAASLLDALTEEGSHRPWSDRYGPANLEELAVHKKKVSDVHKWLADVLSGQDRRRLLILKGPAGSGKSTTLSLLSNTLKVPLIPWNNPTASEVGSTSSVAMQFSDFLSRSGQFGSLGFNGQTQNDTSASRRVLVVEEFPTTMTRSSSAIDSFRSVLLQYVAASSTGQPAMFNGKQSNLDTHPPVVLIVTETLLTSNTAATDSFTAHRLLGPEISNHPLVSILEFNPVAPTFIVKALDLVAKKEARDTKRRRTPGPAVLQRLAEMGDVRSAVNSLEFLCVRGDDTGDWSGTVAAKSKKSAKDSGYLTNMEKQSLELVSQRETTLDMFHAVGKVVYNKREDPKILEPEADPPPAPPDHLAHLNKPKLSIVDIDALLGETGTDIQTFLSALHENYVLSCNGPAFVDCFAASAVWLSDSDVLNPESRRSFGRNYGGTGVAIQGSGSTDMLRQDEISFQVATLGLIFALPFPVNRAAHPGGRRADSFKMFYPASLRLWKPREEIESLVEMYVNQIAPDRMLGSAGTTRNDAGAEGVASWAQRGRNAFAMAENGDHDDISDTETHTALPSREALTLIQLPFLRKIRASKGSDVRHLTKIAQFHGLNVEISGDEPFEDEMEVDEVVANPASEVRQMPPPPPPPAGPGNVNVNTKASQEVQMEKLYISDDDIQDD